MKKLNPNAAVSPYELPKTTFFEYPKQIEMMLNYRKYVRIQALYLMNH